jgi:hypothetical protein
MILPPHYERRIIILKDIDCKFTGFKYTFTKGSAYVLYVDLDRRLSTIKNIFLDRLFPRLEGERHQTQSFLSHTMILFRKYILTICEGLAS